MKKVLSLDGVEYTLATITAGTAKGFSFSKEDGGRLAPRDFNRSLIAASLGAGGHSDAEDIVDGLPIFLGSAFAKFLGVALEVNGLKVEGKTGEGQPEETPAAPESTGSASTDA